MLRSTLSLIVLAAVCLGVPSGAVGSVATCSAFTDPEHDVTSMLPEAAHDPRAAGRIDITSISLSASGDDVVFEVRVRDLGAPAHAAASWDLFAMWIAVRESHEVHAWRQGHRWLFGVDGRLGRASGSVDASTGTIRIVARADALGAAPAGTARVSYGLTVRSSLQPTGPTGSTADTLLSVAPAAAWDEASAGYFRHPVPLDGGCITYPSVSDTPMCVSAVDARGDAAGPGRATSEGAAVDVLELSAGSENDALVVVLRVADLHGARSTGSDGAVYRVNVEVVSDYRESGSLAFFAAWVEGAWRFWVDAMGEELDPGRARGSVDLGLGSFRFGVPLDLIPELRRGARLWGLSAYSGEGPRIPTDDRLVAHMVLFDDTAWTGDRRRALSDPCPEAWSRA